MKRSDGCDWLDRQVDRTVQMNIGCDPVLRGVPKLGTPGDVAQRDQILKFFSTAEMCWDMFGILNLFFLKNQYPTLVKKN